MSSDNTGPLLRRESYGLHKSLPTGSVCIPPPHPLEGWGWDPMVILKWHNKEEKGWKSTKEKKNRKKNGERHFSNPSSS